MILFLCMWVHSGAYAWAFDLKISFSDFIYYLVIQLVNLSYFQIIFCFLSSSASCHKYQVYVLPSHNQSTSLNIQLNWATIIFFVVQSLLSYLFILRLDYIEMLISTLIRLGARFNRSELFAERIFVMLSSNVILNVI